MRTLALLLISVVSLFGQTYSVSVLTPPPGWVIAKVTAINNSNQVAGTATANNGTTSQAFVGTASGATLIPLPDGLSDTEATAMNGAGQVVGFGNNSSGYEQGWAGNSSGSAAIPLPDGWPVSVPTGLNNAGQITGYGPAFTGTASAITPVPFPTSWIADGGEAINNLGQITGFAYSMPINYFSFIGTASGSAQVPIPAGWSEAAGYAINDSGQLAGYGTNAARQFQSFVGTAAGTSPIPLPAGATVSLSQNGSQNNSGVIVGYSDAGGWIWSATGGTQLLNPLVPAGWNIDRADAINDNGVILATGAFQGGPEETAELIPVPSGDTVITIQTSPPGLQFIIGGVTWTAPQSIPFPAGSSQNVSLATTQAGATGTQYLFTSWSDHEAASHSITVNGPATYTATFQPEYQLSISAGTGGTVTPATGQYYAPGTSVPVIATPINDYVFTNWTGNVANPNAASTTITMNSPQTLTANFVPTLSAITIQTVPAGLQFTVDAGVAQTAPQVLNLTNGTHTLAVVTPQPGAVGTRYAFESWSDGGDGDASHTITVSGPATYTATFQTQYQLTIAAGAGGTVTPSSGQYYASGTSVLISTTAATGYVFTNWTGNVADPNVSLTTVTMNSPQTVTANFALATTGVTIQTNPPGLPFTVNGGAPQTAPQTLTLSNGSYTVSVATTQPGATGTRYLFTSWSDGSSAASRSMNVTGAPITLTANFQTQYQLTVSAAPAAGGVATGTSGFYNAGTVVPLSASAHTGYEFAGWLGNVASRTAASTTVTLNSPQSVTADFKLIQHEPRR